MKSKISLVYLTLVGCLSANAPSLAKPIALPSLAQIPNSTQNPTPTISPGITQSGFRCDTSGDVPTTMYQSSQGNPEPWIQWVSDHFTGSGWSPDSRCQEVSARLETYRKNKQLRYVTLGTVNNQSVICVASQDQGPCEGIIYTLKPGQDGIQALNNLFAWRKGEEGLQSNYESVTAIPYIDVGARLDETQAAEPINIESPIPAEPSTNQQTLPEVVMPDSHREL
ncbi:MAG: COP23 domain-containing protein [Cyanobacteria bacterium P01_G01_bin.67]